MTYDHWKTTEPPRSEPFYSCDCCGRSVPYEQVHFIGAFDAPPWIDTTQCDECADAAFTEMLAYLPKRTTPCGDR